MAVTVSVNGCPSHKLPEIGDTFWFTIVGRVFTVTVAVADVLVLLQLSVITQV
jgi:hypothetical protein